jgi:hypothetical protein
MFTSQMILNGTVKPNEIVKVIGVLSITAKICAKLFREHGAKGFYNSKPRKSSASLLERARSLLEQGRSVP